MRSCLLTLLCLLLASPLTFAQEKPARRQPAPKQPALPKPGDFAHTVMPILKNHCAKCHANGTYKGSISMDTRDSLIDSQALVPGKPDESKMIKRVTAGPLTRMPPKSAGDPLKPEQIATLRRWIKAGAPWADGFTFKSADSTVPLELQPVKIPPATEKSGNHPIDRLLARYAKEHDVKLAPVVDDRTFIRRVYLDLIGILPSPEELEAFLKDKRPNKRARLVAGLLQRDRDFAAHWMTFWNDLLRNAYAGTGYIDGGRKQITKWLHESLLENVHYDEFVRQLINPTDGSEGFVKGIVWRGKINSAQTPEMQFSQNVAQIFLGINLKCASCHDSFISKWELEDAYGLASVISEKPMELYRCEIPQGRFATPKFVFPQLGAIDPKAPVAERQEQLAQLMTDPRNGRLSRTIVNRIWQRMMGRALVEPVDHMASPAWYPALLEYLAGYLQEHDYNLQKLMAHIATSQAYQRETVEQASATSNEDFLFRGPFVKRMTAEEFVDAFWTITETGPKKPDSHLPIESLSDGVYGPKVRAAFMIATPLMRSLGRPPRAQVVTTRPDTLTMLQALDLANGPALAGMLQKAAKELAARYHDRPPQKAIGDLFVKSLCRPPSDDEQAAALVLLGKKPTEEGFADLLWALIMLPEFQHIR